jgi:hypothetical protein
MSSRSIQYARDEHGHHLLNDEAALQDFTLRFRGSVVKGLGRDFVLSSTCLYHASNREFIGGII